MAKDCIEMFVLSKIYQSSDFNFKTQQLSILLSYVGYISDKSYKLKKNNNSNLFKLKGKKKERVVQVKKKIGFLSPFNKPDKSPFLILKG